MCDSGVVSSLLKTGVQKRVEIFEGWVVFRYHKESLRSSFCCYICCFLIDKWGDLIIGGKHLLRESPLEAKINDKGKWWIPPKMVPGLKAFLEVLC